MTRTNRITRSVAVAAAALAIGAPVAAAMPITEPPTGLGTAQDLRAPDTVDAATTSQGKDLRSPDAVDAATKPALQALPTVQASDDGDESPWIYIVPGAILSAMLAASVAYALRPSARARRAHA